MLAACTSPRAPQESHVALTREQLVALVPNSQLERINQSGGVRRWSNNADGTAAIVRLPKPGAKSASVGKASGRWSITEDGKYCLDEEWRVEAGGPSNGARDCTKTP
jgi:hypothetical protein